MDNDNDYAYEPDDKSYTNHDNDEHNDQYDKDENSTSDKNDNIWDYAGILPVCLSRQVCLANLSTNIVLRDNRRMLGLFRKREQDIACQFHV